MKDISKEGKIINVIMPKGKAKDLIEALYNAGYLEYSYMSVRGYDSRDMGKNGLPMAVEKDMVSVVAENQAKGEEIFDFIYFTAKLNEPRGGMMYMSGLGANSIFALPKIESNS